MFVGIGLALTKPSGKGGPPLFPPVNTVAPVVSGTPTEGQVLSCTQGTWSPAGTSYAYQWRRDGTPIGGATSTTYTLVTADVGTLVSCAVTATNTDGSSAPAASNNLGPVAAAPPAQALDPAYKAATITLSNSDRTATLAATVGLVRSITPHSSGKWHFEVTKGSGEFYIGVVRDTTAATASPIPAGSNAAVVDTAGGSIAIQGSGFAPIPGGAIGTGQTVAVEVDLDSNLIYFQRQGQARSISYDISVNAGTRFAIIGGAASTGVGTINTGQSAFVITPTSGFSAWG